MRQHPEQKKRAHPEATLQRAIAKYLRTVLVPPGTWFTSIAHGVRLDDDGDVAWLRGAQAQGRGTKSGIPDMLILDGGRAYWGEVKSMKGTLSDAQRETIPAIQRARCPVAIWRSIDDVAASLAEWGIPTREAKRSMEGIVHPSLECRMVCTNPKCDAAGSIHWHPTGRIDQPYIGGLPNAVAWPDSGPLVRRKGAK
jgi:hypothetical protein